MDEDYILVADDDPAIIAIMMKTLLSDGYKVRHATNGSEALEIAREDPPLMVILDVAMPKLNGIHVCSALRRDERFLTVPILIVSARARTDEVIEGLDAGADDYIVKPFEVPELKARVRALLRRAQVQQPAPAGPLQVGEITLNQDNYEVASAEKTSRLTATEFRLMRYLMQHPNKVFSHPDLLEAVWDYPADTGDTDLVRTHIRKLRAKIGSRYIQTVHGVGYMLTGDPPDDDEN